MPKAWIVDIAENLKSRHPEAAAELLKDDLQKRVIAAKGNYFFGQVIDALEDNISELNEALKGSPAAAKTSLTAKSSSYVFARAHFPRFSYIITPLPSGLDVLDTARQQTIAYLFHVGQNSELSLRRACGENADCFNRPAEFAEFLFRRAMGSHGA